MLILKRHLLKRKSASGDFQHIFIQSSSVNKETNIQKQSSRDDVFKQNLPQSSGIFKINFVQCPSVGTFKETLVQIPGVGIYNGNLSQIPSVDISKEASTQSSSVGIFDKNLPQKFGQSSSDSLFKQKYSHSSRDYFLKNNLKQSSSDVIFKGNSSHSCRRNIFHAILTEWQNSRVELFKQKSQGQNCTVSILKPDFPQNQSSGFGYFGQNWKRRMIHVHQVVRNFGTERKEDRFSQSEIHCLQFEDIPSPKGLPVFGTTLSLILSGGASKLHAYADKRHKSLGPIFKENLGNIQAVFISHPDYMRAVFAQEGKYPVHVLPEAWILYNKLYGCSRGLFFMDGEEWLRNRRIMNKFLLKGGSDYGWIKRACEISSMDLIGELKKMYGVLESDNSSHLKDSKTGLQERNARAVVEDWKESKVPKEDFVFEENSQETKEHLVACKSNPENSYEETKDNLEACKTNAKNSYKETQKYLETCKINPKISHKEQEDFVVSKPLAGLENENLESKLYRWSLDTIIAILLGDQTYLKNKERLQPKLEIISKKINLIFETSAKLQFIPAALAAKFEIKAWRNFKNSVDEALLETNDLVRELLKDYQKNEGLLGMMVEEEMDEEDVVKIVVDLVLAAGDTTAYTMEWVLYLLAKNQEQQEFLYQEIFGNNAGLLSERNIQISRYDQQEGPYKEMMRNNKEAFPCEGITKNLNQKQQDLDEGNVRNQQENIVDEISKNKGKEMRNQDIMRKNIKGFSSEGVINILNQKQQECLDQRNVMNQQGNIANEISKNQQEYEGKDMLNQEIMRNNIEGFSSVGIIKIPNQKQCLDETNARNQQQIIDDEISKNQQEYLGGENFKNPIFDENILLRNVIKETLRLYPVAPFLTRILPEDSKIGPYLIPKNTLILYSLYTSGRDEAYFENPDSFAPERWRSRSKNMAQSSLPFAMGSRSCVGRKIAEFQLQIALRNVLEDFKVEMKNEVDVEIVLKMVAVPDKPLELKLTQREK